MYFIKGNRKEQNSYSKENDGNPTQNRFFSRMEPKDSRQFPNYLKFTLLNKKSLSNLFSTHAKHRVDYHGRALLADVGDTEGPSCKGHDIARQL